MASYLATQGRILYISAVDVSIGNGPGVNERQFTAALARAFAERVHFLLPRPAASLTHLPPNQCTFSHPHLRHHPLHWPRHMYSQIQMARRLLSDGRFDLIVVRVDLFPLSLHRILSEARLPYVTKTLSQTLLWMFDKRWGRLGSLPERINRRLVRDLVAGALVSDACSRAQVDFFADILAVPRRKLVWIDNGVDTTMFYPRPTREVRRQLGLERFEPIIGYVGGAPSQRGARQMVEVLPALLPRYPRLGAVIVGHGPGVSALKQRAAELGVAEHVMFTGYRPFDEVPAYVNSFDVGVSISDAVDRYAAAELKVRQYVACGKPVVASPGSNDFLAEEGLGSIVDARDLEGIAAALDRWLSMDEGERRAFGERAAGYAREHLSEDGMLARRLALWEERWLEWREKQGKE
ncbi:MAG: glycosyltransferase [Caldilineae bacterium]|nr:MAG: glycosyltransferase [Caldilineae bacterium]